VPSLALTVAAALALAGAGAARTGAAGGPVPRGLAADTALAAPQDSTRHYMIATAPAESLHVVMEGGGRPLVLIPGLFGSVFGFRKLLPLLTAAGYQVIIVEPLGFGTSGRPAHADYSLTAQSDRVAAVLDSLHIEHAIIVGHSIGGAIGFRLAIRHAAMVEGLVTIEGGPTERAATPAMGRAMRFAPLIKVFGGMRLVRHELHHSLVAASGDTTWITQTVIDGYTVGAAENLGATLHAYRAMADSREPEPLAPHLGEITCPVRMILGEAPHDGGPPLAELELLRRSLRSFAIDAVPGAGHFVFEEQPEAVVASIERLRAELPAR